MFQEVRNSQEKILSDVVKLSTSKSNNDKPFQKSRGKQISFKLLTFLMVFGITFTSLLALFHYDRYKKNLYNHLNSNTEINISINSQNKLQKIYDTKIYSNMYQGDDYLAQSILVYDIESNQKVYSKNSNIQYLIASLTKLATVKLMYDNVDLTQITTIDEESSTKGGSGLEFKLNDKFDNFDLLKSAVIASNNQALYAIQDEQKTITELNNYAKALHLKSTIFDNPVGYDDKQGNFSTVEDLVPIALAFFENKELKDLAGTESTIITEQNSKSEVEVKTTNELLKNDYYPVIAGKTGTTLKAGQNLVLLIEKNNRKYLIIMLGSTDRYHDAIKILSRI